MLQPLRVDSRRNGSDAKRSSGGIALLIPIWVKEKMNSAAETTSSAGSAARVPKSHETGAASILRRISKMMPNAAAIPRYKHASILISWPLKRAYAL